jgi:hypothetical protein
MKLVEFNYTKVNGVKSNRAVVVVQEPVNNIAGIDVTELDEPTFAMFLQEYREVKNRQHAELLELMQRHDLKHNYRQFKPEKMTDIETTWV